jgi:hypothetical protein
MMWAAWRVGVGNERGVYVEGGRCQGVAQPTRDGAYVDAGGEEAGGDEVAHVMQAQLVEAGVVAKVAECPAGRVRPPRPPAGWVAAEHVAV